MLSTTLQCMGILLPLSPVEVFYFFWSLSLHGLPFWHVSESFWSYFVSFSFISDLVKMGVSLSCFFLILTVSAAETLITNTNHCCSYCKLRFMYFLCLNGPIFSVISFHGDPTPSFQSADMLTSLKSDIHSKKTLIIYSKHIF